MQRVHRRLDLRSIRLDPTASAVNKAQASGERGRKNGVVRFIVKNHHLQIQAGVAPRLNLVEEFLQLFNPVLF
jgi:hypothetical protein